MKLTTKPILGIVSVGYIKKFVTEGVVKYSAKQLFMLFLFYTIHLTGASADDASPDYITIGVAFPTPTNYVDFDFGLGGYVNVGWQTHFGLFEVEYFDTTRPARSDYAHDIEQDRIPGTGPTDYYSRAVTTSWGIMSKRNNMLLNANVGFSYREYQVKSPGENANDTAFGLSYGAGVGWPVFEKGFIMLEYSSIDHLIGTANLGLRIFL